MNSSSEPTLSRPPSDSQAWRGLLLTASGALVLAWIGCSIWYDITTLGNGLIQIFFWSRTGEALSLGLGAQAIHYFLIGVVLLFLGVIAFRPTITDAIGRKLKSPRESMTE